MSLIRKYLKCLMVFTTLIILVAINSGCMDNNQKSNNSKIGGYNITTNNTICIEVTVICDNPTTNDYKLIGKEPKNVSLYKFYYVIRDIPGSGTFERLKTVPLKKIGENKYRGIIIVNRSELSKNYTYCVGYPPLNYIDGKACVIVPLNENITYFKVTVHYWRSLKAVG